MTTPLPPLEQAQRILDDAAAGLARIAHWHRGAQDALEGIRRAQELLREVAENKE